jgi:hypothetical protein
LDYANQRERNRELLLRCLREPDKPDAAQSTWLEVGWLGDQPVLAEGNRQRITIWVRPPAIARRRLRSDTLTPARVEIYGSYRLEADRVVDEVSTILREAGLDPPVRMDS